MPTNQGKSSKPLKFDNQTLAGKVRDYLRDEIVADRLASGAWLREADLAEELEISRAPIREALHLLAAEGFVELVPRRGAVVTSWSREEFLQAYQVRGALEALAVRLAVPNLTQKDLDTLRRLHEQMAEDGRKDDVKAFFEKNLAFHGVLVERSGNGILMETHDKLMQQIKRYRAPSLTVRGGIDRSLAEHEDILVSAEKGDAEQAAQKMTEHIQVPQRLIENASEEDWRLALEESRKGVMK